MSHHTRLGVGVAERYTDRNPASATRTSQGVPVEQVLDIDPAAFMADAASDDALVGDESLIEDELLVEEVSIDGMCGVY